MTKASETDLYPPVKAFFETLGYDVKGEVKDADLVALRGDEEPLIVELKLGFSLILLQQAVARQRLSDRVYVAVPRWSGKSGWRTFKGNIGLCKRLGLGVLSVRLSDGYVQLHNDPAPFQPKKSKVKHAALLKEFKARKGDPTQGGTNGQIETAYRQDALACANWIATHGPSSGATIAKEQNIPRATRIMADNHYGWFERIERGVYGLTETGKETLKG